MQNCIFCKIVAREIPVEPVYEDEEIIAFPDVNPQAPVHVLVIPKKHMANLLEMSDEDNALLTRMHSVVRQLAKELGIADEGFRLVVNTRDNGGQTVHHLHFHILGGRFMTWPPG
jgi:histidine triad (HIT) family protein